MLYCYNWTSIHCCIPEPSGNFRGPACGGRGIGLEGRREIKNLRTSCPKVLRLWWAQYVVWQGLLRGFRRMEAFMALSNTDQMSIHLISLFLHVRGGYGPALRILTMGYGSTCFTRAPDRLYRGPSIDFTNITRGKSFLFFPRGVIRENNGIMLVEMRGRPIILQPL